MAVFNSVRCFRSFYTPTTCRCYCSVTGMKPGQRKVLFTCLKRNLTKELKVAQLAGSVAEISAYHHGETSLMGMLFYS